MVIRRTFYDDDGIEILMTYSNYGGKMLLDINNDQEYITLSLDRIDALIGHLQDIKYEYELDNLGKIE